MTPRTTPSDNDLVRRIRTGEGEAAASLRARHWSSVFDFSLRMTASVETARRIADEVFDRAGNYPPTATESFLSWAFAAAHRRVMAQPGRLANRSTELEDDVEIVVDLRTEAGPIDETLAIQVWDAMTRLDRQTQAVIDLHLRQGLDPSELAPILGISERDAARTVQTMKRTAAETIAALLLVTDDEHVCVDLRDTETEADARLHIANCEICADRRSARYSPLQILGALRIVPAGPIEAPVPVVAPERASRFKTPLGVLSMVAGAIAIILVGMLAWDGIIEPIGRRVIQVVRPATTPTTTLAPPGSTGAPILIAATDDAAQLMEDEQLEIPVLENDAEGGEVDGTLEVISPPDHGTTTVIGSRILYVPEADYNGADTFTYELIATDGSVSQANVNVAVIPVDDIPTIIGVGSIAATEDEAVRVDLADWVSDVDGDSIDVVSFAPTTDGGGTVDETLLYTPAAHFNGVDSFGIVVTDGTTELSFPIVFSVAAVNDVPVGPREVAFTTEEDSAVSFDPLAGWSDADGDDLVVVLGSTATLHGGEATLSGGRLTYQPALEFSGADRLIYRVFDGTAVVTVGVDVEVSEFADPPVVTRSSFSVREDAQIGTVLGFLRATDAEGDTFTFSIGQSSSVVSVSPGGRVALIQSLDFESTQRIAVSTVVVDATGASTRFDMVIRVSDVDEAPTGKDQQLLVTPFADKGTDIGQVVVKDPEGSKLEFTELNGDPGNVLTVTKSGMLRTTKKADPSLYPLTIAVEAKDPGGHSTTVLVVVRLDDFTDPTVGNVSVSEDELWEQRPNGSGCPLGPSRSNIAVAVSDSSGIASATIEWSAVFNGVPLSGSTRMAVSGEMATGSFTFGAGLVEDGGSSLLTARVVVLDRAGNKTTTGPFSITVWSCAV